MSRFFRFFLLVGIVFSSSVNAEILTVRQIKELIQKGGSGEQVAAVYADGVVAGLLALASTQRMESGVLSEFCDFFEAADEGRPLPNPALNVKALVSAWERQGRDMDVVFAELMMNYMSAQYGCNS